MGGRASKSSALPPPPERSDIRCRVSTWASFSNGVGDYLDANACVGAVVYDVQRDRVLVAAGFGGGARPTCILTYRFEARAPDNRGGGSESIGTPTVHGVLDDGGAWYVHRSFDGFALAPPLQVHAWPPFAVPATRRAASLTETGWCSSNSVIVHDAGEIYRSIRHGDCTSISHHLRQPQRMSAIAVDSRGHLAHIERDAPVADFDILWVHAIRGLGLPDSNGSADDDGGDRIAKSERLAPPVGLLRWQQLSCPPIDDAVHVTKDGRREPKWMGLVAVAFDADDRIYVIDRGVTTRRCHLYQSRAPLARPTHLPSLALAGTEVPCEWTLVADLSAALARSHFGNLGSVFLAIDTFRRRAYVAHSTCVYVACLDDSCGGRDQVPAVRIALGRFEILAGHSLMNGDRDGSGTQALLADITGCAIRTRPICETRDVAPVVGAIRAFTAIGGGRWPPGVAEIVESYARASGLPAASLVLSDHGGRRMRQIDLL
jgi:hypothetical protein